MHSPLMLHLTIPLRRCLLERRVRDGLTWEDDGILVIGPR